MAAGAASRVAAARAPLSARASAAVAGAIVFAVAVAAFARVPVLPDIGFDLRLSASEIGLLTTSFGVGRLVMDLPAGRLAARVDAASSLAAGGVGLALGAGLFAAAGSFFVALVASAVIGCASALTNTTGMYAFATATAARRGASMALYTTALMSGQMLGPALGGVIGSLSDWRVTLAFAAAIGLGVVAACLFVRRRFEPTTATERERGEHAATAAAGPAMRPARRLELMALAAAPFATFFGMAGLTQTLVPLIGADELGLSASTIGLAIAAGIATRFASAWFAGVTSDRLPRRLVLVPMLATMAVGSAALALPIGTGSWLVAIVALAVGSSGISVAAAALADRVEPARLGHELGVFRLLGDVGLLVGPAVTTLLYQHASPGAAALAAAGVLGLAAVTAALWVRDPARAGGPESRPEALAE